MFTVGEFARLGQVSKRLLRYYDEIGLLKPIDTDASSGYRFYSGNQLAELNRILALKELGLSLDQIRRMLSEHISTDEMRGMLLMKKAEIEQELQAEMQRIRKIESRLQLIRNSENSEPLNVVVKKIPAMPVLGVRTNVPTFEAGMDLFSEILAILSDRTRYGLCYCICYDDEFTDFDMDLEMGRLLMVKSHDAVALTDELQLQYREIPAAEHVATTVVKGALETIHTGYHNIAQWIANSGYRLAGIPRELTLELPHQSDGSDLVTEIQFPIEPIQSSMEG